MDEIGRMPFLTAACWSSLPVRCAEVLGVDSGSVRSEDGGALFEQVVGFWFDQALSVHSLMSLMSCSAGVQFRDQPRQPARGRGRGEKLPHGVRCDAPGNPVAGDAIPAGS